MKALGSSFRRRVLGLSLTLAVVILPMAGPAAAQADSPPSSSAQAGPEGKGGKGDGPAPGEPLKDLAEVVSNLEPVVGPRGEPGEGFLDLWREPDRGRIWIELPASAPEGHPPGVLARLLWTEALTTGFGSNPVGLDRGQLGETRVARFRRVGGKVLFELENTGFRASTDDPLEARAVEESFADSVVWAGPIVAAGERGGEEEEGGRRILVELTPLLLSDVHRIGPRLEQQGEGSFEVDAERSGVDPAAVLVFPDNVEIDAVLTYAGTGAGTHVRSTAVTPEAFTLRQHHSFVRLPEPGFVPRPFDPRCGSWSVDFQDYAVPLTEPIEGRYMGRFRLQATEPGAPSSPVVEPIVFHVDPGTPEPVRSALVEGASWWVEAFEAAGLEDAYRVEMLPADAHPLDVRYNVVQWVHRSTRGWSYGGGVTDPRTGEILKGHVNLGSLRVRQDRLIFEGLLGVERTGSGAPDDPVELALARIRQLAAHEVGHALGLAHNFAASTYGRASVMDYPAPWVRAREAAGGASLDVSEAYAVGVGAWDRHAVEVAYRQFAPGTDLGEALEALYDRAREEGWIYLTDADARPAGAAHPLANLWDNGTDPLDELTNVLAVRRIALARFGKGNLAEDRPVALLQEVLAPIYYYHRYQLQAAVKSLGGLDYRYAVVGEGREAARPVLAERQRRALELVLGTLAPAELDLPDRVVALLLPRPPGHPPNRELFPGAMDPAFDPLAAAAAAADFAVAGLVQRHRAARLVDQHRRDPELPGFEEVLDRLVATAFPAPSAGAREKAENPRERPLRHAVQEVVVARLVELAGDPRTPGAVRHRAELALEEIRTLLESDGARAPLRRQVERFLEREGPAGEAPPDAPPLPPGSPIGAGLDDLAPFGACSWGG